jgi:hypothetical protein
MKLSLSLGPRQAGAHGGRLPIPQGDAGARGWGGGAVTLPVVSCAPRRGAVPEAMSLADSESSLSGVNGAARGRAIEVSICKEAKGQG